MKYAFFDLDGTLADTDPDIRLAWRASIADENLECPRFDELFVAGPPFDEMTEILFPERTDKKELSERLRHNYARHYDNDGFPATKEYPGVLDAVKDLKARGVAVYIVTNKRHAGTLAITKCFGWDQVFDGVYSTDMYRETLGVLKKGALLVRLMEELGAERGASVMVGDSYRDFEAAKVAGIRSVGVDWGYGKPEELAMADKLISESADLCDAVMEQFA